MRSRVVIGFLLSCGFSLLAACGGGGGGGGNSVSGPTVPTGSNVQSISVNGGPSGGVNLALTTITVCIPGTSQCQVIDNVFIDTGSTGLRLLSTALNGLALPQQNTALNRPLVECVQYVDLSHTWGPVKLADIKIAGEAGASVPIQVITDPNDLSAPVEPTSCSGGFPEANLNTVDKLGANGILGIGNFRQDCGEFCQSDVNNDHYFECAGTSCTNTVATLSSQVQNPVAFFTGDNNGVILQLPAISPSGAAQVNGYLLFGIGTRDNNALGSAQIHTVGNSLSAQPGYLATVYKNTTYNQSFIDSGSNGLFFPDASIPTCSSSTDFYCPATTLNLSGAIVGINNVSSTVSFSVANTENLSMSFSVFNDLAGPFSGGFDWGLPFFLGRKVFVAIENSNGITDPYIAF